MTQYNWRDDDGIDWTQGEGPSAGPEPTRWRHGLIPLITIILIVGALALVYAQLQTRVDDAESRYKAEIQGGAELINRAVVANDQELFVAQLSGANDSWMGAQITLFAENNFYDRPAFGLRWRGPIAQPAWSVRLDGALRSGLLSQHHAYNVPQANGGNIAITLEQKQIYRLGTGDRWLHAPPPSDYWGTPRTYIGEQIHLRYPERDASFSRPLAALVDDVLSKICRENPSSDCATREPLFVTLSTEPSSILDMEQGDNLPSAGASLTLPTVSLVGLPRDETGELWLRQGYLRLITMAYLAHQADYQCCRRGVFLQAAADYLLSEQGLFIYPRQPDAYQNLVASLTDIRFDSSRRLGGLELTWQSDQWRYPYAVIDFAFSTRQTADAVAILSQILSGRGGVMWLAELLELSGDNRRNLDIAWYRFLAAEVESAAPIDRAVELLCTEPDESLYHRYHLRPVDNQLQRADVNHPGYLGQPHPLPDGSGLILDPLEDALLQIHLFNGHRYDLNDGGIEIRDQSYTGRTSPDGSKILVYNNVGQRNSEFSFAIYDLDRCQAADCEPNFVSGYGRWSPSSQRYVFTVPADANRATVYVTNGSGQMSEQLPLSVLGSPAWLDDENLLLILPDQVVSYHVASGQQTRILTPSDILARQALPDLADDAQVWLSEVLPVPGAGDQFLVFGRISGDLPSGTNFLLRYEAVSERFEPIVAAADSWFVPLGVSSEHSWLTIYQFQFADEFALYNRALVQMYHYASRQTFEFTIDTTTTFLLQPIDEHGSWLLLPGAEFIRLIDPISGGQSYFFPEQDLACSAALWITDE